MDFPGVCLGNEVKKNGDRVRGCFAGAKCRPRGFQGCVYGIFRVGGMVEMPDLIIFDCPLFFFLSLTELTGVTEKEKREEKLLRNQRPRTTENGERLPMAIMQRNVDGVDWVDIVETLRAASPEKK